MDIPKRDDDTNDLPGSDRVMTTDSDVIDLGPIDDQDLPVAAPFSTGPAVARAARRTPAAKKRAKAAKRGGAKKAARKAATGRAAKRKPASKKSGNKRGKAKPKKKAGRRPKSKKR